jgi:hypothetical protein
MDTSLQSRMHEFSEKLQTFAIVKLQELEIWHSTETEWLC